ncbi:MAG: phage tail tip lysozyme [Clostridia bacterium]|nr:phage tail tip lysozyme [Clostridia bacterium]
MLNGTTNEEKIWNFLKAKSLNDYAVAGIMGNLYAESALSPTNLQNTYETKLGMTDAEYTAAVDDGSYTNFVKDSAGYGLAQWTYYTRKQNLLDYAEAEGASIGDLEMQLGFLWKELQGYTSLMTTLKSATSVTEASTAVLTQYERPANQGTSVQTTRASYGQKYYDKYAGASSTTAATTTSSSSTTSSTLEYAVGDQVNFTGTTHYTSSNATTAKTCKAGVAKVTATAKSAKHPYHLVRVTGGTSTVYGWVDAADISGKATETTTTTTTEKEATTMATKTNTGLVAYAKAQVGLPYWYGTYGQTASASLYTSKKSQYPSYYTASDFSSQYGKRVHDCVGLIKGYLWSSSATATPSYTSAQDKSASGMYAAATTKGTISSFPKTTGLLVFKGTSTSKITHVGVYGGDGYVYEAKGHQYGVVKTAFSASAWQYWAQCPYCTNDVTSTTGSTTTTTTATTTTSGSSSSSSSSSSATEKKATDAAQSYLKSLAGTYKTTANLNMRNGAGTSKKLMVTLPKGTSVKNYGYYTTSGGTKWLYVQVTYNSVKYTGFCSSAYLQKQ